MELNWIIIIIITIIIITIIIIIIIIITIIIIIIIIITTRILSASPFRPPQPGKAKYSSTPLVRSYLSKYFVSCLKTSAERVMMMI